MRRVTAAIRREMKRRATVEPVIGHVKAEHRMDRNYLKGRAGDRINAVLAAAGYNFGLLLHWLSKLLRLLSHALHRAHRHGGRLNGCQTALFTDDSVAEAPQDARRQCRTDRFNGSLTPKCETS